MRIAAYQDGFGICGIGDTEEQAREEAKGSIIDMLNADEVDEALAELKFAPISDELVERCHEHGGHVIPIDDVPFKLIDGTLHYTEPDEISPDNNE